MLPRGMVSVRPWACFHIRIYKAEGLPTMDSGLMAKMAVATDRTVFIDPYVRVTFAGQQVGGSPSPVPFLSRSELKRSLNPLQYWYVIYKSIV